MSVLLTVALAAATHFQPSCSWDQPGVNPYKGSSAAAIERYTDIPEQVRNTLKRRIAEHQSDDQVRITRDAIVGKNQYEPGIRDMHFGAASVCGSVTRSKWAEQRQEPGAVYCVGEHCVLVPRICGNISRITRLPAASMSAPRPVGAPAAAPVAQNSAIAPRPAARPQLAQGAAPAPVSSRLGDGFGARDTGKAVATPQESATPGDDDQDRHRAPGRVAQVVEIVQQPGDSESTPFADNDDGDRNGLPGRLPGWPNNDGHNDGGPVIPPSPVPEADSWAMLLAGLAVVGALACRRARRSAAR
jgi:hypothetical protein